MNIEQESLLWVRITDNDGRFIRSQSVEANLLFAMLEKLEEIRCGLIDVEEAANLR